MSMQIPDYAAFAQMPVGARQQSLEMIRRFAGQHATSLFLQVYQFDPDPGIREMARAELAKQGVTPPTDPTPIEARPGSIGMDGASFGQSAGLNDASAYQFSFGGQAQSNFDASTIDGGNGRPVQRGPQLANVFTLFRNTGKYLTGERNHIPHNPLIYVLLTVIFAGVMGIMAVAFRSFGAMPMGGFSLDFVLYLVGGIFGLILLVAWGVYFWNIRRNRRYERNGTLLLGRVLNADGRWHTSTSSEGATSRSFRVTIHYRVRLPDGSTFDSNASTARDDLANSILPAPGAPVAVLVIDRDNMRLL